MDNNQNPNIDADSPEENQTADQDINSQSAQDTPADSPPPSTYTQRRNNDTDDAPQKKKLSEFFSPKDMWNNFKEWWGNSSPGTKRFIIGTFIATIILIVLIIIVVNTGNMTVAFSSLEPTEAGEIMTILRNNKIKFDYNSALGTIAVKSKDAANIVMALALEGYPRIGYAFTPIQSSGMFMTDADKQREELENRKLWLETSINTLEGVEYSLVTITPADNRNKILQSEQEYSSASVIVHVKQGEQLSRKSIMGIETLVLRGVPDIKLENISIHDGNAVLLNVPEEDNEVIDTLYELIKKVERDYEEKYNQSSWNFMEPLFGEENMRISTRVTVDLDKWVAESVTYTGTNENEDGVQSGIQAGRGVDISQGHNQDSAAAGEVPDINTDAEGYYEVPFDTEDGVWYSDYHITEENLVNQLTKQMEHNSPAIKAISLTVSINMEELDPDVEENLLRGLATATGINDIALQAALDSGEMFDSELYRNYITIVPYTFYSPDDFFEEPPEGLFWNLTLTQLIIIGAIILLVLILLVVIIVVLLRKRKRGAEEQEILAEGDMELDEFGKAIAKHVVDEEAESSIPPESRERMLKNQIKVFTDQNAEIAAQLIKTMLKEEAPPNG